MLATVRDFLLYAGYAYSDRIAVRHRDRERTYADLIDRSCALANALYGKGLSQGDRVAVMVQDGLEPIEAYLGCAIGGFVAVAVNHRASALEVGYYLEDSGAKAIVHTKAMAEVLEATGCTGDLLTLSIGGDGPRGFVDYESALALASTTPPAVHIDPGAPAVVGYTSGTTGQAKGAVFTQERQLAVTNTMCAVYRVPMHGATNFTGSLSFIGGLCSLPYPTLRTGGTLRFHGEFDPDRWFAEMAADHTTHTFVPTPMMAPFAERARAHPAVIETLAAAVHSASPAPRPMRAEFAELLGPRYVEVWGMTESLGYAVTSTTPLDRLGRCAADDPLSTVGRPSLGAVVTVVDEARNALSPGSDVGELVIECDWLFTGYWNKPEATAGALVDGRYYTGDLGRIDHQGYVYLTGGRRSEMIITGGMNVYPVEVEQALVAHPDIEEAAVFGVGHDRWGETVAAAVVRRPGSDVSDDDVMSFVRGRIASYKKPTRVYFVDDFPRTTSLKIKKHELRRRLGLSE